MIQFNLMSSPKEEAFQPLLYSSEKQKIVKKVTNTLYQRSTKGTSLSEHVQNIQLKIPKGSKQINIRLKVNFLQSNLNRKQEYQSFYTPPQFYTQYKKPDESFKYQSTHCAQKYYQSCSQSINMNGQKGYQAEEKKQFQLQNDKLDSRLRSDKEQNVSGSNLNSKIKQKEYSFNNSQKSQTNPGGQSNIQNKKKDLQGNFYSITNSTTYATPEKQTMIVESMGITKQKQGDQKVEIQNSSFLPFFQKNDTQIMQTSHKNVREKHVQTNNKHQFLPHSSKCFQKSVIQSKRIFQQGYRCPYKKNKKIYLTTRFSRNIEEVEVPEMIFKRWETLKNNTE